MGFPPGAAQEVELSPHQTDYLPSRNTINAALPRCVITYRRPANIGSRDSSAGKEIQSFPAALKCNVKY